MGKETGISWTTHTMNPWWGCTKVSPGCDHCYAETVDLKFSPDPHWGKGVARRVFGDKHWDEPLAWNRAAQKANRTDKVFCASMADVMDDEAPEGQRDRLWELIDKTPNLLWQLLTKRPQRYERYLPSGGFAHDNVILGTTTESQEWYDLRMPYLHRAQQHLEMCNDINRKGFKRIRTFISYEPALGSLSIRKFPSIRPDWIIFGGETGDGRRPMEQKWAEDIKSECEEFGIAFFMKQMSAFRPATAANLIPPHLLIRNFPV